MRTGTKPLISKEIPYRERSPVPPAGAARRPRPFDRPNGVSLLITSGAQGKACINLLELHARFERAVRAYRRNLKTNFALQAHFAIMFPKYGAIPIRP